MTSENAYQLTGKTAVVTGSAQGLGLGTAAELARLGAHVVLADLQQEKVESAAAKLAEQNLSVEAATIDITDSSAVGEFFHRIATERDGLDILVNNAGMGQDVCSVSELSDDHWDRVIGVTLTGTFYCCRAAAQIMEQQEAGTIVNVASINGQNPAALVAAYNVAKAGVISLTRTLAMELAAYGVRVNAVSPGPVYTDFNKKVMAQRCDSLDIGEADMIERVRQAVPLGRWGEPEDIAHSIAFLCSPAAGWITGEVLTVSGGLSGVSAAPPKRSKS